MIETVVTPVQDEYTRSQSVMNTSCVMNIKEKHDKCGYGRLKTQTQKGLLSLLNYSAKMKSFIRNSKWKCKILTVDLLSSF